MKTNFLRRPGLPAVIAALVATPILAAGTWFLEFEGDPTRLSALRPETQRDQDALAGVWGAPAQMTSLIVEGQSLADALAANDRLAEWLDAERGAGRLVSHGSIAGILPSPATQARRRAAWRAFWTDARIAQMERTLALATAQSPFRTGAFEPFVAWLRQPPALIDDDAPQAEGPLRPLLAERVHRSSTGWRVLTPITTRDWDQTAGLADALAGALPDVTLLNKQAFARRLAAMVTGEIGLLAVVSLLIVSVVVFFWVGRPLLTLIIVLPLVLSLAWTLGLLGWFGIPISLANAIFVAFLFGVAVDYAIFLTVSRLDRFRTGVDHTTRAQASVLLCTLTTCGGFGSLAVAGHPVMHSIGVTALIGILSAALTTQIFVPALTGAVLRRHGPNGTPGLPHVWAALWIFGVLVGGGVWHLLTRRRGGAAEIRQRAAIDAIHRMSKRIHDHVPMGRHRYDNFEKVLAEPCILVANHESMYDIIGTLVLPRPIHVLVKGWVWKMPIMGHMARAAGYVLTEGRAPDAVLADVRRSLAHGISVLVFPEGKRTRTGRIGRFHNGAFAMARECGVRVQPIAMVNTRDAIARGTWWLGDHDSLISILDPVDPVEFAGASADRIMARTVRDRIRDRVQELRPQTLDGPHWYRIVGGMYRYLGPLVSHYAMSKCKRDPLIRALPTLCPGVAPILVAGSGYGLAAARLALASPDRPITCVDLDERKLQCARAALGDAGPVRFLAGDIRSVDPTSAEHGAVETVLAIDILHYWGETAQRDVVLRLAAMLPAGGRLIFREGCHDASHGHRLVFASEKLATATGFTRARDTLLFRTRSEWRALLESCGFTVDAERPELGAMSNLVLVCSRGPVD